MSRAQLTSTRVEITRTVVLHGYDVGCVRREVSATRYSRRRVITAWCSECSADIGPGGVACPDVPHRFGSDQEAADAVGEHALRCDQTLTRMSAARAVA
jgi:hypothetical protein